MVWEALREVLGAAGSEEETFRTWSFVCCGAEHCKSLFELGEYEQADELQALWGSRMMGAFQGAAREGRAKSNLQLILERLKLR